MVEIIFCFNYRFENDWLINKHHSFTWIILKTIVLKPGTAGRFRTRPTRDWRKNRERKNSVWPSWPRAGWPGKTWLKTRLQPIDFCFFLLKRHHFDFLKKIWLGDRSKLGTRALDRAGSKNYAENSLKILFIK
jgi:hypothetical protein